MSSSKSSASYLPLSIAIHGPDELSESLGLQEEEQGWVYQSSLNEQVDDVEFWKRAKVRWLNIEVMSKRSPRHTTAV